MIIVGKENLLEMAHKKIDVWAYSFVKSKSNKKNRSCHTRPVRGQIIDNCGHPYFIPYGSKGKLTVSKRKDIYSCQLNISNNEQEAKREYNKLVEKQMKNLQSQMDELKELLFDLKS